MSDPISRVKARLRQLEAHLREQDEARAVEGAGERSELEARHELQTRAVLMMITKMVQLGNLAGLGRVRVLIEDVVRRARQDLSDGCRGASE